MLAGIEAKLFTMLSQVRLVRLPMLADREVKSLFHLVDKLSPPRDHELIPLKRASAGKAGAVVALVAVGSGSLAESGVAVVVVVGVFIFVSVVLLLLPQAVSVSAVRAMAAMVVRCLRIMVWMSGG